MSGPVARAGVPYKGKEYVVIAVANLRRGALIFLAALLSACGGGGGEGGEAAVTALTVAATTPVNGATGVALTTTVSATASRALDPATLNALTFTLVAVGGGPVAGTISVSGNTATFTPTSALAPSTQYVATITTGAGLAADYAWNFTTLTVPGAPVIGTASATGTSGQVSVAFTPPASNGGATITSYTVTSNPGGIVVSGAASPITVSGLIDGTPYTFTVTATNIVGVSPPSAPSNSVTPGAGAVPPGAPTFTVAPTAGSSQATVNFNAPASSGSSPIISYTVTSSPGGISASGGGTSIVVPGLTNGTAYTFTAVAFNSAGPGPASAPSASVTPAGIPGAPTGAVAVANVVLGVGQATVSFNAPASNGGSTITGYTVTSNPGGGVDTNAGTPGLSHVVTGLVVGTPYTFTVTATNAAGTGAPSSPSNSVTPTPASTVPTAPAAPAAVAGNAQATVSFTPLLTAPANGGSPVISYTVTSSPGGISASGAASPIVVPGLTNGTAYTFTITATNSVGTGAASAPSNAVTPATAPGAPTIGTATGGNAQATVSFTPPASNGGSAITTYTVTPNPGGAPLAKTGAASPIVVTGLTNGVAYTFTVTATNGVPLTGPPSAASNSATPTAGTVPGAPTGAAASVAPGATQATVTFSVPASDGGSPITGYTVTSSPAGGTDINAGSTSLSHTVTGLAFGTAYTFTVKATNSVGAGPASGASNAVTPATVPGAPTTVTATAGDQQATVSFTPPASNGGSAITFYTATSSPGGISAFGGASPIVIPSPMLTNGVAYTFTVTATNAVGTGPASAASNSATPNPATTVPSAPTGASASAGNGQATVTFGAPASNGGSAITGYTVTSSPGGFTGTSVGAVPAPVTVTGLTNGTAYTFTVTATNGVGASPPSGASNSVTPATVPDAPTAASATAGNGQATVSFAPPVNNGGAAITSYTVTSNPGGLTGTGGASPIVVSGLTNGQAYTFTVRATNSVGLGAASAPTGSVTPNPAATVPGAPGGATATGGNGQATVNFTAPASDGGSAITGYTVTSSPGGFTGTSVGAAPAPVTVTGLANGTAYTFTVTATNAIGTGPASGASNSVTPATLPGAPTAASAIAGNGQATISFTAPASNGGAAIIAYTATSNPGGISLSASASPIVLTGLTNGQAYTFTVTATNIVGTGPASAPTTAVTPTNAIVPTAPLGPITATAGAGGTATVTFSAPACALTTCSPITGYTVSSSPSGGTDTNAGTTGLSHTITGLTIGTPYTFTVTASNALGTSPNSAASNSVTPSGPPSQPAAPVATATGVSGQVSVAFTAPANNGSAITSYTVFRQSGAPGPVSVSGASSPILVNGLTDGNTYTFTVSATNGNGSGPISAASNNVTPTTAPAACPVAGPPAISVTPSRTTGVAPLAVVFDATGTTSAAVTSRPYHEIEYLWNFGDLSSSNWFPTDGSGVPVAFLNRSGGVATAVTGAPHGFSTGDRIRIRGANETGYNLEAIVTVVNATTFTYPVAVGTATPATGTVIATSPATGASRNYAAGPVASHVFEAPGTYAIAVTANDGTNTASCSVSVTVQDPAVVFAGANTTCVSSTSTPVAGVGGCPAGANVLLQPNLVTIFNTLALPGKRVLLKGGDVFTGASPATLTQNGPGIVGSYGTGKAILRTSSTTNFSTILSVGGASVTDWRLMDLEFDGQGDPHRQAMDGSQRFNQLTLLRLYMHDIGSGMEFPPDSATALAPIYDQIALVDTVMARLNNGFPAGVANSHGLLAAATRLTIAGNWFNNSLGSQHMLRIPYVNLGVISNNLIELVNTTKEMVALRGPSTSNFPGNTNFYGTGAPKNLGWNGAAGATKFAVVSQNLIFNNTGAGGIRIGPSSGNDAAIIQDIIVERNFIGVVPGGGGAVSGVGVQASSVTVRNNIFDSSNQSDPTIIQVNGATAAMSASANVFVYNNTLFSSNSTGCVNGLLFLSGTNGIAKNNLGYTKGAGGCSTMLNNQSGGGLTASNNSSDSQMRGLAPFNAANYPLFVNGTPTTGADFKIQAGSPYVGAGTPVPVWTDYRAVPEPSPRDLGAVNH
jgi:hypothetical protein